MSRKNRLFNSVRSLVKPRANFDLSRTNKMSLRMAQLVPCMVEQSIPGDTMWLGQSALCRFAPMSAPIMHNINLKTFYFNVPMRLLFDKWEEFITGGEDGLSAPQFPVLRFTSGRSVSAFFYEILFENGGLADYLGFPSKSKQDIQNITNAQDRIDIQASFDIDLTPFLAYQLIWNEYFRDQNVDEEFKVKDLYDLYGGIILAEDMDMASDYTSNDDLTEWVVNLISLRKKCWDKNYFTSGLPSPQRGQAVEIPISGQVEYIAYDDPRRGSITQSRERGGLVNIDTGDGVSFRFNVSGEAKGTSDDVASNRLTDQNNTKVYEYDPGNSLQVHTGNADVTELRRAIKLQEFLEAMSRGGSRYIEQMKTMFGVSSSDARLQRPEFLGAVKQPVIISEVLQTSESANTPQGNMSGRGVSAGSSRAFSKFHEEHSLVVGLVCVMPDFDLFNGLPRKYTKFERLDYYWHQFDHIGEQEIRNSELFFDAQTQPISSGTFAYAPRYSEYKSAQNEVHGEFKDTLDFWHMGYEFASVPALNSDFLRPSENLLNRPFAVNGVEQIYLEMYFNFTAKRMMSRMSTPKID